MIPHTAPATIIFHKSRMKRISSAIQEWRVTAVAGIVAICIIWMVAFLDIVELKYEAIDRLPIRQIDYILAAFAIMIAGLIVDRRFANLRTRREIEVSEQRLQAHRVTMNTVQDIVNNFLANAQFFKMEAEGMLPETTLEAYEALIQETSAKLSALGTMKSLPEVKMAVGVGIDYSESVQLNEAYGVGV